MLKNLQLTYLIRDEVLVITTPDAAQKEVQVCVYDVHDLLGPYEDQSLNQFVKMIDEIMSEQSGSGCMGGGGPEPGGVRPVQPGALIASYDRYNQDFLRELLAAIRAVNRPNSRLAPRANL
jgi:hypothetical protein